MDVPMIYTVRGNLPIASLAYSTEWENNDDYAKFTETYKLGDEVVRQSAHVYSKRGVTAVGGVGSFKQGA